MRLSKSRFLSGLQCHKRLYLEMHAPELASEVDDQRKAIMDMGKDIGEAARLRFPKGILIEEDYRHNPAALQHTADLLDKPEVTAIFEAAFQYQGTLVRVDVLERRSEQEWNLIEVKAASRLKAVHVEDLAVQTHVVEGAGLTVGSICLMHVNRHYTYTGGPIDFHQLFALQDVTEMVRERLVDIPGQLEKMRDMLGKFIPPSIEPDGHCHSPYACPFWEHCTKEKPKRWIFHLPGEKYVFQQLHSSGIESIDDIPHEFHLTVLQRRVKDNVEWVSPEMEKVLRSVQYPVHHLDFETFMPAIPFYPQTRPYQPLPVQWSNHIEFEDTSLRHDSYLCLDQKDPREEVAVNLLKSVGQEGTICVYSEYERYVLLSLADALPHLRRELNQVIGRLWDLLFVIQNHYYHPNFQGSFSIKSVLPALIPSLSYDDLVIQDGASASVMYYKMVFHETDWVERARLAQALLQYCARDTLGMVELRRALIRKCEAML